MKKKKKKPEASFFFFYTRIFFLKWCHFLMNNSLPSISELRNNLNFASISQFFHTFSSAFRPWPIQHYNEEQEQEEYVFETEVIKKHFMQTILCSFIHVGP